MSGIEVERGSVKELLLLAYANKEEKIEELKFRIMHSATTLDNTNSEQVNSYNDLLREYRELTFPQVKDRHFEKDAEEMLKDLASVRFKAQGKKDLEEFK